MNKNLKSDFDDAHYQSTINNSNKLGNALLACVINDKINDKKKKIAKINVLSEFVNYKNQIEKLRSLKVGFIHNILSERNIEELDLHLEVAEKILNKISQLLNDHVLQDASKILSKAEFDELINNGASLEAIQKDIQNIPNHAAPCLENIQEFQKSLQHIIDCIHKTSLIVQESQSNVLKDTSKAMDCL